VSTWGFFLITRNPGNYESDGFSFAGYDSDRSMNITELRSSFPPLSYVLYLQTTPELRCSGPFFPSSRRSMLADTAPVGRPKRRRPRDQAPSVSAFAKVPKEERPVSSQIKSRVCQMKLELFLRRAVSALPQLLCTPQFAGVSPELFV